MFCANAEKCSCGLESVLQRIKLQDALQHPWLVEESDMDPEEVDNRLDTMVVSRLQRYATYGVFKQQAMVAILRSDFL